MNRLWLFLLISIVVSACGASIEEVTPSATPTLIPTSTPSPTVETPDLEALDWHIGSSMSRDVELFRCSIIQNLDGTTANLIAPLNVILTGVFVTPQIYQQAGNIFQYVTTVENNPIDLVRENSDIMLFLLRFDFEEGNDLDQPFEMYQLSTTDNELRLNSLREIRFLFGDASLSDEVLLLKVGSQTFSAQQDTLRFEAEPGRIYAFTFDTSEISVEGRHGPTLIARVELLVPFPLDTCETDHYGEFQLEFTSIPGDSNLIFDLFGTEELSPIGDDLVRDFRTNLMGRILPNIEVIVPTSTPTLTHTPEPTQTHAPPTDEPPNTPDATATPP